MAEGFLAGKTAMVTGGASGMGLAMAVAFASAGANVSIGSLLAGGHKAEGEVGHFPGQEEMDHALTLIAEHGAEALGLNLDVTVDESVDEFYQRTVDLIGPIDILANAAGITAEHTIVGHSDSLWNKVIEVNLTGTYRTIKRVLPAMIERKWGRIINIASTAASVGAVTSGAYCASKAGVVGLTRAVALEGAPHGVTCNAISPTWVDTSFAREWMSDIAEKQEHRSGAEYVADVEKANPQGRLISPSEIGALALFLCSEGAKGITMEDLRVSAGSLW
jgi:NAD(P)-dependent dehydrogenase (short-subunit alcohol dehydrogenase family)